LALVTYDPEMESVIRDCCTGTEKLRYIIYLDALRIKEARIKSLSKITATL
jgi:hypothetical protein